MGLPGIDRSEPAGSPCKHTDIAHPWAMVRSFVDDGVVIKEGSGDKNLFVKKQVAPTLAPRHAQALQQPGNQSNQEMVGGPQRGSLVVWIRRKCRNFPPCWRGYGMRAGKKPNVS